MHICRLTGITILMLREQVAREHLPLSSSKPIAFATITIMTAMKASEATPIRTAITGVVVLTSVVVEPKK